ncbi:MAG: ABC transporter permease [Sarcina sp.]
MKKIYLILMIVVLAFISLFLGAKNINIQEVLRGNEEAIKLLFISRIPRLVSIILAAIGLSVSGLIMQKISQNKFVSPTTGATIDSAQLGILVAMIIMPGASIFTKSMISFVFALTGTFLFMKFIGKLKVKNAIFIPLIGIILGNVIGSITTFLGYRFDMMQVVGSWMQGKFSMILKGNYELLFLTVPLIALAIYYGSKFTVIAMGEDFSKSLGVNYKRVLNVALVIVSLVTVLVIITAGNIPYVGLIVPNIVALYKGDNIKESIWDTALFGVVFVLGCDIISRLIIYPYEVSVSLTIGVIGTVLFLYLLRKGKKYEVSC